MKTEIVRLQTGELEENCYIVASKDLKEAIIIDPGADFDKITKKISELEKRPGAVLLTHCHFDHVGDCHLFDKMGVPIYLSPEDVLLIGSPGSLAGFFGTKLNPFKVKKELTESTENICGFIVEVIRTPGHTAGSLCYKIGNVIFTGDTIFKGSYGRTDFPTGSQKDLCESAKKLFSINEDCTLFPGHGEATSLFYEKENNPILCAGGSLW